MLFLGIQILFSSYLLGQTREPDDLGIRPEDFPIDFIRFEDRDKRKAETKPEKIKLPPKKKVYFGKQDFVRFIRLRHNGKDWDFNMGKNGDSLMLSKFSELTNGIRAAKLSESVSFEELRIANLKSPPAFLYVTGKESFSVSPDEAEVIRKYLLESGGTIIGDSPGGKFSPRSQR